MYLPRGSIGFSWKLHHLFYRKYNYKHLFSICVSFHDSCKIYMIGCCTPYQIYVVNGISNNAQQQEIKNLFRSIWPHMFLLLFTEITCERLSLNLNQYVIITKEQKKSYEFQENVTLSCKSGFTRKSMTTRCTDVDTWSPNIPLCTSKFVIMY